MSHALVCSSGVLAAPRPAHYRFLRRSRQLVLRSKHALQCIPLRPEGFGLIRCRSTARANWNSVKHHTNLSGRLGSAADAVFCRGPRSDQGRVFACAHNVQQCESDEGHLQDAAKFVLSLRSELDSLERKQLSPACSTAINQLVALCQSGRQEEVAEALAQVLFCNRTMYMPAVPVKHTHCKANKLYDYFPILLNRKLSVMTASGHDLARGRLSIVSGVVGPGTVVLSSRGPGIKFAAVTIASSASTCCIVPASNWRSLCSFHAPSLAGPFCAAMYAEPCSISRCSYQQQLQGIHFSGSRVFTDSS